MYLRTGERWLGTGGEGGDEQSIGRGLCGTRGEDKIFY